MVYSLLSSTNAYLFVILTGVSSNAPQFSLQDVLVLNSTNWWWFSNIVQTNYQSLHVQDTKAFYQTRLREQTFEVATTTRDYRSSSQVIFLLILFEFCFAEE